jgi:hypothetical protein
MSKAVIAQNAQGEWTAAEWSEPIKLTGADGAAGAAGSTGPAMVYRGEYLPSLSPFHIYYGTPERVDVVKYNDNYYVARVDEGEFNALPTDTSKWNTFGAQFESIATGLLFVETGATIAGFQFYNNRIESRQKTDGQPNILLDGMNGTASITGGLTSNSDGNQIIIDSDNRRIRLVGSTGDTVGQWSFLDDSSFINISDSIRDTGLGLVGLTASNSNIFSWYFGGEMYIGEILTNAPTPGLTPFRESYFTVKIDAAIPMGSTLRVGMKYLPTTAQTLPSGGVWRDSSGYLRVV